MPLGLLYRSEAKPATTPKSEVQVLATRIVRDPDVMVGKPTVRGTRITVEAVLARLADNPDIDDLLAAYPRLALNDVRACIEYASRSEAEIE
jgi:uncharacterized protein (DUF433 family)